MSGEYYLTDADVYTPSWCPETTFGTSPTSVQYVALPGIFKHLELDGGDPKFTARGASTIRPYAAFRRTMNPTYSFSIDMSDDFTSVNSTYASLLGLSLGALNTSTGVISLRGATNGTSDSTLNSKTLWAKQTIQSAAQAYTAIEYVMNGCVAENFTLSLKEDGTVTYDESGWGRELTNTTISGSTMATADHSSTFPIWDWRGDMANSYGLTIQINGTSYTHMPIKEMKLTGKNTLHRGRTHNQRYCQSIFASGQQIDGEITFYDIDTTLHTYLRTIPTNAAGKMTVTIRLAKSTQALNITLTDIITTDDMKWRHEPNSGERLIRVPFVVLGDNLAIDVKA